MRRPHCLLIGLEDSFTKEYAPFCLQLGTVTTRKLIIKQTYHFAFSVPNNARRINVFYVYVYVYV
jgi:hypothetical protein